MKRHFGIALFIGLWLMVWAMAVMNDAGATPPCLHGDGAVTGTAGDDHLCGGNAKDVVKGLQGDDVLAGNHSQDELYGGTGDDVLWGGKGPDVLDGGPGFDVCHNRAGTGHDTVVNCEVVDG